MLPTEHVLFAFVYNNELLKNDCMCFLCGELLMGLFSQNESSVRKELEVIDPEVFELHFIKK